MKLQASTGILQDHFILFENREIPIDNSRIGCYVGLLRSITEAHGYTCKAQTDSKADYTNIFCSTCTVHNASQFSSTTHAYGKQTAKTGAARQRHPMYKYYLIYHELQQGAAPIITTQYIRPRNVHMTTNQPDHYIIDLTSANSQSDMPAFILFHLTRDCSEEKVPSVQTGFQPSKGYRLQKRHAHKKMNNPITKTIEVQNHPASGASGSSNVYKKKIRDLKRTTEHIFPKQVSAKCTSWFRRP